MIKVMTTGTFDIMHIGHVKLLERAKKMGDYLVVGLNTDACVAKSGKIVAYSYEQRKEMLKSIKFVDEVVPIDKQEDKFEILKKEDIDIFAIGSDYKGYPDIVDIEEYCEVKFIERTPNVSTTRAKKIIKESTKSNPKVYNTIVVDIDDTINFTINRDFENSIPNHDVIKKINELHDKGWRIVLFTARGQNSCGNDIELIEKKYLNVTKNWMDKNNVKYDEIRFGKPNADYYIDDKNLSLDQFINYDFEINK